MEDALSLDPTVVFLCWRTVGFRIGSAGGIPFVIIVPKETIYLSIGFSPKFLRAGGMNLRGYPPHPNIELE